MSAFAESYVCPAVELLDRSGGKVVGLATKVPYVGRLFDYQLPGAAKRTTFRFIDRTRAEYARGYKWWEAKQ